MWEEKNKHLSHRHHDDILMQFFTFLIWHNLLLWESKKMHF
jgi:hypothetical protein